MMEIRPACPYCKSIRISGTEWRINGLPQQFWCRDCGHTWTYEALDDMRREALAAVGVEYKESKDE